MNNKQKKVLCLALLLTSAPAVLHAMQQGAGVGAQADPNDQPEAPRLNMYRRTLERISSARQATQESWDDLSPRKKTAAKVVAGAGILGAVGFIGHKLYKRFWAKPVVTVEVKSWDARFFDLNESVLMPLVKEHAPETEQDLDAVLLRSVVSEAVETLEPHLLLQNDAFVGLLTPEQRAELEEICALKEADRA